MAMITRQQMYDAWKRVQDWVSGASSDRPKVVNVNGAGTEIFTDANPAAVKVTGSNVIKGAVQNVPTAGTRVQLPSFACREVTIIALRTNNGRIYVGGSDVSSTVYGADLGPEDAITIPVSNANMIYIDASVSGEGVSYVAV